jgi:hypothetical protein
MIEFPRCAFLAVATGLPLLAAGAAAADDQQTVYVRTDLVSNTKNLVQPLDPQLQNAWGVANAPGGALWVSDNNDGLSTLYDGNGVKQGLVVTIPLPPGKVAPPAAAPTGMVWNPTTASRLRWAGQPSRRLSFSIRRTERLSPGTRPSIRSPPDSRRRQLSSTILQTAPSTKASPSAPTRMATFCSRQILRLARSITTTPSDILMSPNVIEFEARSVRR